MHRSQFTFSRLIQLPTSMLATLAIRNLSNQPSSSSSSTITEANSAKRTHSHLIHGVPTSDNNSNHNNNNNNDDDDNNNNSNYNNLMKGDRKGREGDYSAKQRHRMEGIVRDCEEVQEPLCGELCTEMMEYLLGEYWGEIPSQAMKLLCDGLVALVTIEDSETSK